METITHFSVGNGNCSLIEGEDFVMIIDLNSTEDKESSFELLKPYFRKKDGKDCIDVLCITHGDLDHCSGFKKFKEAMDNDELVTGSIWHQGYDRRIYEDKKDLSEDYQELQKEIDRRAKITNPSFGDIQKALEASNSSEEAFDGVEKPSEMEVKILSPFSKDDEASEYCHNDQSLVLNLEFKSLNVLYASDSSSKYWQDRIIPELLDKKSTQDWARASILVVSHHGSYTFFGDNRDDVRNADPEPDNYDALNRIKPTNLIISSKKKFPTSKDQSGDEPAHYAAYKWYHKWFRENRSVSEEDKHPRSFRYTNENNVRLEYKGDQWVWIKNWDHNPPEEVEESKESKLRGLAATILTSGAVTDRHGQIRKEGYSTGVSNKPHRNYGGQFENL